MASYLIKKNNDTNEIVFMEYELEGYKFKPNSSKASIEVKEVTIVNPSMIENILEAKYNKAFQRVLMATYEALKQEDKKALTSIKKALEEIEKLKQILLGKYQKFLSKEKEKKFLVKLELMEQQLNIKLNHSINMEKWFKGLLAKLILLLNEDETSEEDATIVIDETARLKSVLANYNEKELNKFKEYISRLEILEKELKKKVRLIREKKVEKEINNMSRSSLYEKETNKVR